MNLQSFFTQHPKCAVAFSGGCDSAYLLYQAFCYSSQVCAYYMNTPFQPAFELEDAQKFCKDYRIPLVVLTQDVCQNSEIVKNDSMRCYYCKQAIFSQISEAAKSDGYTTLLDGTNASDRVDQRPGMKALLELEVLSPLRLCGLTKPQIREHSKELGLFTHNKPAYACLATRIATDTAITALDLQRVEACEAILSELGFFDFRVRIFHNAARIQLPSRQLSLACDISDTINNSFSPYFEDIMLDLLPR